MSSTATAERPVLTAVPAPTVRLERPTEGPSPVELALRPVAGVFAGALLWSWEHAGPVLQAYRSWVEDVPAGVVSVARIIQLPPMPEIPEPLRGRQFVAVEAALPGDESAAARILRPLRALAPEIDFFATTPPAELLEVDRLDGSCAQFATDGVLLDALPPEAVDAFVAAAGPASGSPLLSAEIRHLGGEDGFAVTAVGTAASAELRLMAARQAARVTAAVRPWWSARTAG